MLALLLTALFLVVSSLTRFVLIAIEARNRIPAVATLFRSLAAGAAADVVAASWLALPIVLLLAILGRRISRTRAARILLRTSLAASLTLAFFVAAAEIAFFREFNGRFNFVAVDYLVYPHEVITNVWESYPTGWILAGVVFAGLGTVWGFRRFVREALEAESPAGRRFGVAAAWLATAIALTAAAPALSTDLSDRAWNEIAQNGYATFLSSLRGQDAPYQGLYPTAPAAPARSRLQALLTQPGVVWGPDGFPLRRVHSRRSLRRLNVVVVLEESLGSEFVGALRPDGKACTPELDRLSRDGLLLTRAYSTGNRTIRALEAVTASIPPLPGISIVRRDRSQGLFTLPAVLRDIGYRTMFVYGGRAAFDGMGRYMRSNGVDEVIELSDFPRGSFRTAWGVADEAIFDRSLEEMEAAHRSGRPFFTLILTTSNHRPFLYPEGRIAFDPQQKSRENAVRYADWALGQFFRKARGRAFFEETLFVVMGDHGPRVYGASRIPMASYEVPILFYSPGSFPAGRLSTISSSMDVAPTVLGLLGLEYESKFFGRDVFTVSPRDGRAPLTHNANVALLEEDVLAILGLQGTATAWRYDPRDESLSPLSREMTEASQVLGDAVAYFQVADELYRSGSYRFDARSTRLAQGRVSPALRR
ncbi:MAG TPA: LTA synthase family protein [Thermoanaerobaculia bacterium]